MTNNKHVGFLIADALLVASVSVWTVDKHHPATTSQPSAATPAKTTPATIDSVDTEKCFEQARQQIKKIQTQMDKIHQTKDPKERQCLMTEHMQTMQDTMQTMHGVGDLMMMDMMGGRGMGAGGTAPMMGDSSMPMEQRMNVIEDRMDTIQIVMDQMFKQQEPSKKPRRYHCGKVNTAQNWSTDARDAYLLIISLNLHNI